MNGKKVYLIYSPGVEGQLAKVLEHPLIAEAGIEIRKVKLADLSAVHVHDQQDHAILWIEQKDYSAVLQAAAQKKLSLGFLPIAGDDAPCQFFKALDLPGDFDTCLKIALHEEPLSIDLVVCNGEVVSNGVNLENQTTMAEFIDDSHDCKGFDRIGFKLRRLVHAFSLRPHPVMLQTAKGKTVTTAITGMVLLDFHKSGFLTQLYNDSVSMRDGRISVALFAPQSILSYLQLSASLLKSGKNKLPQQVGYIRSESVVITSPVDTHYLVNNKPLTTRELRLETTGDGLRVNAGDKFRERQQYSDDKENVSCDQLPQQADRIKYLSKTLPFFTHAMESDFKDLFLALKDNASLSSTFVLLMVLSALLASLGLFLNSPSVVIGAMVLAPLMAPIVSLAMGVLRSDAELSRRSFLTLLTGIAIALLLSATMAWLLPFQEVTGEIEGRLHPSTLDLLVAVLSGVAGAFAHARENIAKSLPGVAIAVALVPPLCVSGIGLGWHNMDVFSGAMLLFLTNLTGIIMAAGLSFMVIGFAPISRAKKGILISVLMVSVISVPLYVSFVDMQKIAAVRKQLSHRDYVIEGRRQQLRSIKVRLGETMQISAELVTTQMPDINSLPEFERLLSNQLNQPVALELSVRLVSESHFY